MKISDLSIRRPVLATVMNLLIVLAGIWAFLLLPIREYPDVDTPVVSVRTVYRGASPSTVEDSVTVRIEEIIKGIEGIRVIRSTSSLGMSTVEIEFATDRDVDLAATDVQNAVQTIVGRLPPDTERPVVSKAEGGSRVLIWLSVRSNHHAAPDLTDIADRYVKTPLQVLPGVADIIIGGQRTYAMRIWLDPDAMAARGVDPGDIRRTIVQNNLQLPAGRIESHTRQFTVLTDAQIDDPKIYERLIVLKDGANVVRLGDIARVELGASSYHTVTRFNGEPTIGVGIVRQSRANELAVSEAVHDMLPQIEKTLPQDVTLRVAVDRTIFVRESLKEVWLTLGIAFVLVVLVNLFFLRSIITTIITSVAIPVSVVGTFFVLQMFGYSINVLTLLAIVLAVGLLVDDAIVVLENVYRRQEHGEDPVTAALLGTRQVAFPVIATSVSLIAVLIPVGLLTGNIGRLFREFAVTMAGAIAISTFVALTLVPMMCALILRLSKKHGRVYRAIERFLDAANHGYARLLGLSTGHRLATLAFLGLTVAACVVVYRALPRTLAPIEDRGQFLTIIRAPQGSTLAYTDRAVRQAEKAVTKIPEVNTNFAAIGLSMGGPSNTANGMMFTRLHHWDERDRSQQDIVKSLFPKLSAVPGALLFPSNPQSLGQRRSADVEFVIKNPSAALPDLASTVGSVVEELRQVDGLLNQDTDLLLNNPQLEIRFDRDRASDLGVSVEQIAESLQLMIAEGRTDEFVLRNKQYDVIASITPSERSEPEQLGRIHIKNRDGELIPLSNLVQIKTSTAPAELKHYGLVRAATVTANLAPGGNLGAIHDRVQAKVESMLPDGYSMEWTGASREFTESSTELLITFILALVFVYLVLSAQFESFVHSLTILLSVPLAVSGALIALYATGQSMNIFSQIGMILLIGLVSKNAILLVDYANQGRAHGLPLLEAVIEAGRTRFRPILMTSVTSILGAMPLALAAGAGAESRHPIGLAVVGGLIFSTAFTLIVTPVVYIVLVQIADKLRIKTIPPPLELDIEPLGKPAE
jgi:multidrug efflux pump